ncbi:hypothetical protein AB0M20_27705 [Actinoplanes sp. NPDC051633]|uniref:hypothetical protein n=1 Tax=Actinoplanes sp. NPDC051633 TaxID=3155670 RepID=UPI00341D7251
METPDLLLLRLDALRLDIEKVRYAVRRAKERSQFLENAGRYIKPCRGPLQALRTRLQSLVDAMEEEPDIADMIDNASLDLAGQLRGAPDIVTQLLDSVAGTSNCLRQAMASNVSLEDRSLALEASLDRRCNELQEDLKELKRTVEGSSAAQRRTQWMEYQNLLDGVGRPLFVEYVDFLGGLTVRDTGLDDRVCEMTDAVLARFRVATRRSLPLPARQAALGNALDSVVLLGFPEWSIWGIPLVGHEVGLAYVKNTRDNDDLVALIDRFAPPGENPPARTKEHVEELLADAFATYTLGLSYACAALLLRLSPRHDEPADPDRPRDIDRARVIVLVLLAEGDTLPAQGASYSDAVGKLRQIWEAAVRAHASPDRTEQAAEEIQAPPAAADDWLDRLATAAVAHFSSQRYTVRSYDEERWQASERWFAALHGEKAGPAWTPVEDAVPDVLTAAWRTRLLHDAEDVDPVTLAESIKERWSNRQLKGG